MDLTSVIEQFHAAANDFAKGNPEPVKAIYSHRDDVTLANPFGPAVHGWAAVSTALDFASGRMSDGSVPFFDVIAEYATTDLACIHEVEHWEARIGERQGVEPFDLRVTSLYRLEDGSWRLVHRHADPISTAHPEGPLRDR